VGVGVIKGGKGCSKCGWVGVGVAEGGKGCNKCVGGGGKGGGAIWGIG